MIQGLREHIPTMPYEKRLSKVDTLKLAIGYINFLAETLTTGQNPNDESTRPVVEQPKKVILHASSTSLSPGPYSDMYQVIGHSLSVRNENAPPRNGNKLLTKLWTPEDPRRKSNLSYTSTNSSDIMSSSSPDPELQHHYQHQQQDTSNCYNHHHEILSDGYFSNSPYETSLQNSF